MTRLESHLGVPFLAGVTIEAIEKHWIINALRYYSGNKTQTAGALGISIRTLDNKLEKYENDHIAELDRAAGDRADKQRQLDHQRGKFITEYNGLGVANQTNPFQRSAKTAEAQIQNGNETPGRNGMEPAEKHSTESALPVSERQKIQEVLPKQSSHHSSQKRR